MNEASYIVSELQRKLAELDHKVCIYRRDMASEFDKYTDQLLQDVSSDVSETITHTINESLNNYPSLYPHNPPDISSPTSGNRNSYEKSATTSDPLTTSVTDSSKEADLSRSGVYERELQGLFTPSYLPLLDCSSRERRSSLPGLSRRQYADKGSGGESDLMQVDASTEVTGSLTLPPHLNMIKPKRRFTDGDTQSSLEREIGGNIRSALRSPSSSSRAIAQNQSQSENPTQSPRRVRFEVAGKEVLPTSSPLRAPQFFFEDLSETSFDSDENTELEMIEELGDSEPEPEVPNRISSSQALRLLSRQALEDDGTIWTTVCSGSDESLVGDSPLDQQESQTLGEPSEQACKNSNKRLFYL